MSVYRTLLFILIVLYFIGPIASEWMREDVTRWYRPIVAWLGLIIFVQLVLHRRTSRDP